MYVLILFGALFLCCFMIYKLHRRFFKLGEQPEEHPGSAQLSFEYPPNDIYGGQVVVMMGSTEVNDGRSEQVVDYEVRDVVDDKVKDGDDGEVDDDIVKVEVNDKVENVDYEDEKNTVENVDEVKEVDRKIYHGGVCVKVLEQHKVKKFGPNIQECRRDFEKLEKHIEVNTLIQDWKKSADNNLENFVDAELENEITKSLNSEIVDAKVMEMEKYMDVRIEKGKQLNFTKYGKTMINKVKVPETNKFNNVDIDKYERMPDKYQKLSVDKNEICDFDKRGTGDIGVNVLADSEKDVEKQITVDIEKDIEDNIEESASQFESDPERFTRSLDESKSDVERLENNIKEMKTFIQDFSEDVEKDFEKYVDKCLEIVQSLNCAILKSKPKCNQPPATKLSQTSAEIEADWIATFPEVYPTDSIENCQNISHTDGKWFQSQEVCNDRFLDKPIQRFRSPNKNCKQSSAVNLCQLSTESEEDWIATFDDAYPNDSIENSQNVSRTDGKWFESQEVCNHSVLDKPIPRFRSPENNCKQSSAVNLCQLSTDSEEDWIATFDDAYPTDSIENSQNVSHTDGKWFEPQEVDNHSILDKPIPRFRSPENNCKQLSAENLCQPSTDSVADWIATFDDAYLNDSIENSQNVSHTDGKWFEPQEVCNPSILEKPIPRFRSPEIKGRNRPITEVVLLQCDPAEDNYNRIPLFSEKTTKKKKRRKIRGFLNGFKFPKKVKENGKLSQLNSRSFCAIVSRLCTQSHIRRR